MARSSNGSSKMKPLISHRLDQIISSRRISRRDHLDLTSALLADQNISDRDRYQINQILDWVHLGHLDLID